MVNKKIAIYCRRSKPNSSGTSQSVASQKELGIDFAAKEGQDYEVFIDEGISGTKDDIYERPGFAEMLDRIKKGEINKVYCIDQSRIERNNNIWNLFVGIMLDAECLYYPSGRFFDLADDNNIFIAGVLSQANQLYASLTSKKVKLANKRNAEQGKTHGIVAYGYQRGEDGKFEINEEQAKTVRRIYKLSAQGKGAYTIANILNKDKVPTKFNSYDGKIKRVDKYTGRETYFDKSDVKWRGNVVLDMIRNPIYKGLYVWGDSEIKLDVAIISEKEWDSVIANLANNKKKVGRRDEYNYLLNGLIFCDDCGSEFRGKKRLKGSDMAYKCKGKRYPETKCSSRGINIPRIETFILKHLFESKQLRELLITLPNDKNEKDVLNELLEKKKNELQRANSIVQNGQKLLLQEGFEEDSSLLEEVRKAKERRYNLEDDIHVLEEKIEQRNTNYRQERAKNLIDNTKLDDGFEKIKRAVHLLVERIDIKHQKMEKGGVYLFSIKYRDFEEYSNFMTDWKGLKWHWLSRYRKQSTNKTELEEDREELEALYEFHGIELTDESIREFQNASGLSDEEVSKMDYRSSNFKGTEQVIAMHEVIELDKNELVDFD